MNYGPLSYAIEKLLATYITKPPKKDIDGNAEYNFQISRCWDEIFVAEDLLVEDVKNGRI